MLDQASTQVEPVAIEERAPSRDADKADLVVVANRLPVQHAAGASADEWKPSPGGLVSALTSVLQNRNGLWIGWPGTSEHRELPLTYEGIRLKAVDITKEEYENFYLGFSNATLWPLYHDAIRAPTFHRHWWQTYSAVNLRYATAIAESVAPGGTVWIHDYQLQLVPQMLRQLRPDVRIGFFLHIPFPPIELFMQLPWRREILTGLLGADLIGFQVPQAASNFSRMARRQSTATGTDSVLDLNGRTVRVGAFPISVDSEQIIALANDPAIRARAVEIKKGLGDPELVLLGVDRLDYTKGIQQRIKAVSELFEDGSLTAGKHVMVQVAVPSRETDAHYERERHNLEQAVSEMNGEYGQVGSPVIHYLHQNLPFDELVALYLVADVMIVTPFRDGMNLVAKEYVMTRRDLTGRLVLSEFAGAAAELRGAFMVNPHDLEGIKEAIRMAVNAGPKETRDRMSRMRRKTYRRDVYDWAESFLEALQQTNK
ncbi:MAG TPA: trehalose-6-phosphate synthase [Acidimicrobiales bacterium]|jgi:trehalose 6-phosphate synthase|nr:trehalose-6-phosphate synthase [Acidimicrobiales bacterium]